MPYFWIGSISLLKKILMKYFNYLALCGVLCLVFACQKDNDDDTISVPSTGRLFFSCVLDSTQNVQYEHGTANYRNEGVLEKDGDWATQESVFSYYKNKLKLGISVTKMLDGTDTNAQYVDFFSTGEKTLALPAPEDGYTEGLRVYYVDEEGVEWSTDKGNAIQDSSLVEITTHFDYNEEQIVLGSENYVTTATVKCVLYNGEGDSLKLTNGLFKGVTTVFE